MSADALPDRLNTADHPWMTALESRAVIEALTGGVRAEGGPPSVRFVGGCVRDALAGAPVGDIDLATDLVPEEVLRRLEGAEIKAIPTGLDHGTITAVVNHRPFEVTTLRRDVETDGRRAVVAFTTDWREDAERRDFTMNALSADPDGTLHDYFDGRADLAAGRVRFVGDADLRIREDVLRILRFCRFHARFGAGAPAGPDYAACVGRRDLLPQLSAERVQHELSRLLATEAPAETVRAMIADGLLAHWLPEAAAPDALAALVAREAAAGRRDWLRRLAVLCLTDGADAPTADLADRADRIAKRLKLSNQDAARLALLAAPPHPFDPMADGLARREALYRLGADRAWDLALLGLARAEAAGAPVEPWAPLLQEAADWRPMDLPVSGADALAAGLKPGPAVGRALKAVERWWLAEAMAPDRAQCLARLQAEAEALAATQD